MDAKNAKKRRNDLDFSFCRGCEYYKKAQIKQRRYENCPATKMMQEKTYNNTEKRKQIAQFLKISEKQTYRYTNGETNIYKKLNEMNDFARTNFYRILECKLEEVECPHMKKPKVDINLAAPIPDLTNFYSFFIDDLGIEESAINFTDAIYNNAIKYSKKDKLNSADVMTKIESKMEKSKEEFFDIFKKFLIKYEKYIIEFYCGIPNEYNNHIDRPVDKEEFMKEVLKKQIENKSAEKNK